MTSIYLNSDHADFRAELRAFLDTRITPHLDDWEAARVIPRHAWKELGAAGYLGLNFAEADGGTARDIFHSVVLWEELGRTGYAGFRATVALHAYMACPYLSAFASPQLKEQYLRPAVRGELIAGLALTEPQAGSNLQDLSLRAREDGEVYRLTGTKKYIINSTSADFYVVAVRTPTTAPVRASASDVSLLLVDASAQGLRRRPIDNLGYHCSDTGTLEFEDVRVAKTHVIGRPTQGFFYLMKNLQLERLVVACMAIGGIDRCLDDTWDYVVRRRVGGQALSEYQALRHRLADLVAQTEAARQLAYHVAWNYGRGDLPFAECSMVKLNATELASRTVFECMQFHGAYGYQDSASISRMYRDTQVSTIGAGASEVMRDLIAQLTFDEAGWRRKQPLSP
ncbi:MAG: acyl-CoA dehydrogenase family protein, partial [Deltaproteobacteria bacterium]|nr:acyl-CoA dehydrogenase family protein [Deltaproteobacteria bacterium]